MSTRTKDSSISSAFGVEISIGLCKIWKNIARQTKVN